MIEKARVIELKTAAMKAKLGQNVWLDCLEAFDLAIDYLALRAIVEALAADEPWLIKPDAHDWDICKWCLAERIEGDVGIHDEGCLHIRARALVGPAGGEFSPLEIEGVEP